jgi:hypothetical protein
MGGSGADSLAGDLSRLTERQRQVYEFAAAEVQAGRYPGSKMIADRFGVSKAAIRDTIALIVKKVPWPCPIRPTFYRRPRNMVLTPVQDRALRWARREHQEGRYPSERKLAGYLRTNRWRAHMIRQEVARKAGWPCRLVQVRSGTYGLTPNEQRILAVAWELHDGGEYPSKSAIGRILGLKPRAESTIQDCRQLCLSKGIWPGRVKYPKAALSRGQVEFLLDYRRSGRTMGRNYCRLCAAFEEQFGRQVSFTTVRRVFERAGLLRPGTLRPSSIEKRKARVIAERSADFILRARDEPAAFRRALRAGKQDRRRSSGRRVTQETSQGG